MTKRSEVPLRMVDAEAEARFYADVEASILRNRAQGGEPIAHEEVMRRAREIVSEAYRREAARAATNEPRRKEDFRHGAQNLTQR